MYLEQHVFLAGCQIHLVLVVIHADVDDVSQKLLVPRNHLQLLMQALHTNRDKSGSVYCICTWYGGLLNPTIMLNAETLHTNLGDPVVVG